MKAKRFRAALNDEYLERVLGMYDAIALISGPVIRQFARTTLLPASSLLTLPLAARASRY